MKLSNPVMVSLRWVKSRHFGGAIRIVPDYHEVENVIRKGFHYDVGLSHTEK